MCVCLSVSLSIWSWPNGPSVLALLTGNQCLLGPADAATSVEEGDGRGEIKAG